MILEKLFAFYISEVIRMIFQLGGLEFSINQDLEIFLFF